MLAGYLLAVDACYLIATSRWGSYVGIPHSSVYIGDILFGASLTAWVLGGGIALLWRTALRSPLIWVTVALVAWTVVRLAIGSINTVALRDAAPYMYLLGIPVAFTAPVSRRLLAALAFAALAVHAIWLAVALRDPSAFASLPRLGPTSVFSIRTDFDQAMMGVAIGVGLVIALGTSKWTLRVGGLALAAVSAWNVSQMNNRGGLLAAFACLLVVAVGMLWHELRSGAPRRQRTIAAVTGLMLCAGAGIGLAQSPALSRLNNSFYKASGSPPASQPTSTPSTAQSATADTPSPHDRQSKSANSSSSAASTQRARSGGGAPAPTATAAPPTPTPTAAPPPQSGAPNASDASGTTRARRVAWEDVYHYTTATPARAAFGVGFGPNYLKASGGLPLLSGGAPGLRAPHDILLNTWARLGAIGLATYTALLGLGLLTAVTTVRRTGIGNNAAWILLTVAIPIVALVGVILESPFGALPYAFALGLLARWSRRQQADENSAQLTPATLSAPHA